MDKVLMANEEARRVTCPVGTGATYAAFCAALRARWPAVRPVLVALVYGAQRGTLFE